MLDRDHRDDGHALAFGFQGHIHHHFVDPAVGEDRKQSGVEKTKLRRMTRPKPSTCSRNMAWRWPLEPTTRL